MPSRRTKEDTWREKELLDAIQGSGTQKPSSSKASKSGESSKHRSKEEGKDRDRTKHKRPDGEGSHKRESERKEKDKKKEKSEGKDRIDDGKSRRKHKDDHSDKRRGEKETSSRRKEDDIRTETEDERARRKEREKEERHRERRRDKESTRDKEKGSDDRKDKEKRRKHKGEDRERSRVKEDENRKEKRSETKEERKKERSSRKERKDRSDELAYDSIEGETDDSVRVKDRRDKHKDKRNEQEVAREDRRRTPKDVRNDKMLSHGRDGTELFDKEDLLKRDSILTLEEEIEEEMASKRPRVSTRKSSLLNTEEVNEEDIDADDYDYADEDFEDYDDDFEDDNGEDDLDERESPSGLTYEDIEGVDEIRKAIREENQLAESLNDSRSSSRPSTRDEQGGRLPAPSPMSSQKSQPRGKINFIAAKQKQISDKVASRTRRRGQELSKLIELDEVGMDLFELQPFNIYEVYMKSFGRLNTEQIAVQTNDDTIDQEVQTDEIETETRWNQFSNEVQSFGGGDEKASNANVGENSFLRQDTRRLNRFLTRATQLCITLLKEVDSDQDREQNKYIESRTKFSDGYQRFSLANNLTQDRKLVDIDISQSNSALIAYGKHDPEKKEYHSPDGIICVWNLNATSGPQKYLSCGSTPKCCCFSPRKPSFAFAGMDDGSVSAWDLREPDSMHAHRKFGNTEAVLRTETFSTASVYGNETHSSCVVSIGAIASQTDPSESSSSELDNSGNGALQVVSLEENCTVNIWIVIEVFSPDPGGSQQDLGLVPGGKIKLVKSGAILPQIPKRYISMEQMKLFSATKLHIDLPHANSLYIGTDQGVVLHSSRFGNKVNPKYFGINECDTAKVVSSIDHCPWDLPYILVGCTDGSVSIFNSHQGYPLTWWLLFSRGAAIGKVQWSRSKPGVFFALDEESYFYVWDISASESGPLTKDLIKSGASRAVDFFLTNESSEQEQRLVMFYDDNTVEIHRLRKSLSDYSTQTFKQVCARLEEIS